MNRKTSDESTRRLAPFLWIFLLIFILRVIGQMLVALGWQEFLPPMEEWYSGLIPYPWLVVSQMIIIMLYGKICLDFTPARKYFPRRKNKRT